jgi:hypothetical protein
MAKELPFFKFHVSEWNDGNIVDCSMKAQGLFINLCSLYWSRLGDLDEATAMKKLCKKHSVSYKELIDSSIISVENGMISIKFLDEQLGERKAVSEKSRYAALKRWKHDATALPPHSDSNATGMPIREEKNKKREREEESERRYGLTHGNFFIVKSKYLNGPPTVRVNGAGGLREYLEANNSVLNMPERAEKFMQDVTGKVFNEFGHVWNTYTKYIASSGKTTESARDFLKRTVQHR